jgi:hypothetical protein
MDTNFHITIETNGIKIFINETIDEKVIRNIVDVLTKYINKYYETNIGSEYIVTYVLDVMNGQMESCFVFDSFVNQMRINYKNINFVSVAEQISGVASIMYLIAEKRVITNKSKITFLSITEKDMRNNICRTLFQNKIKPTTVKLSIPNAVDTEVTYYGDDCIRHGFATHKLK